jgi:hypothetical protein
MLFLQRRLSFGTGTVGGFDVAYSVSGIRAVYGAYLGHCLSILGC